MSETARVVGHIPAISEREQARDAARGILENTTEVILAVARLDMGYDRERIVGTLRNIHREARGLIGEAQGKRAAAPAAVEIMDGYREDVAEMMHAMAEHLAGALGGPQPPPDYTLRMIGMAADTLAVRINSYLGLRAACGGRS